MTTLRKFMQDKDNGISYKMGLNRYTEQGIITVEEWEKLVQMVSSEDAEMRDLGWTLYQQLGVEERKIWVKEYHELQKQIGYK